MDRKTIAKQLMQFNGSDRDKTLVSIALPQDHSEKSFFSFVDKNPLFPDNSADAVHEFILTSHRRRSDFKNRSGKRDK
ncbi:MAG: hypothetical protein K4571_07790 [Deltaproteobacteria bacterium]